MILLTMKYLLRNLEIELDPPTFPSFNDNRIIYCYIKCIRDEHNNPATLLFLSSQAPWLDLYFIRDNAELWFLSFLFDTVSLWHFYPDCPGQKARPESVSLPGKPFEVAAYQESECLSRKTASEIRNWDNWGLMHCRQISGFLIIRGQDMEMWSDTLPWL